MPLTVIMMFITALSSHFELVHILSLSPVINKDHGQKHITQVEERRYHLGVHSLAVCTLCNCPALWNKDDDFALP